MFQIYKQNYTKFVNQKLSAMLCAESDFDGFLSPRISHCLCRTPVMTLRLGDKFQTFGGFWNV